MRIKYKGRVYKLRESRKDFYLLLMLMGLFLIVGHLEYLEYM